MTTIILATYITLEGVDFAGVGDSHDHFRINHPYICVCVCVWIHNDYIKVIVISYQYLSSLMDVEQSKKSKKVVSKTVNIAKSWLPHLVYTLPLFNPLVHKKAT